MPEVKPQNVVQIDDRAGNAYTIFTVQHTTTGAAATTVELDQSAISVAHLANSGQTVVTPTIDAAGDTTNFQKTVSVPSGSANGSYTLCVRHTGSAAGIGSNKIST